MSAKTQNTRRKFNINPSAMLMAAVTIGRILEANIHHFSNYPLITIEWLNKLYADIERMVKKTGVKANEQQRAATSAIRIIQADAFETVLIIRNQIERGFRNNKLRRAELMNLLGYKTNWTKIRNNNQNALIQLLVTFSNHTAELTDELIAHQVAKVHIDKINSFAQNITEANVLQEFLKSSSPVTTADVNIELNDIYDRVMDICSAGKIVFRNDSIKKEQFNFKRTVSLQTSSGKTGHDEKSEPANNTGSSTGK